MRKHRFLNVVVLLTVVASLLLGGGGAALARPAQLDSGLWAARAAAPAAAPAAPTSPVDETKVPHYFGPFPNWANSPMAFPNVNVAINGNGTGATAEATVGGNGAVTGITITNPGTGYTSATVAITGGGTGAAANATVTLSGSVTGVKVTKGGAGYTAPVVNISGGGGSGAAGRAFGKLDTLTLTNAGSGYTFPTVDFDFPADPNGVQATGHVDWDQNTGAITAIYIDNPGSGYNKAPNVVIRDGTLNSPINNRQVDAARATAQKQGKSTSEPLAPVDANLVNATAKATIALEYVILDQFGSNYTSSPSVSFTDPTGTGAQATATVNVGGVTAITVTNAGSGYITAGGIKKFQDGLPVLCDPKAGWANCTNNNLGQHIPIAVPDQTTFTTAKGFSADSDYYVIALVQHRERMSSSLPQQGTLLREYVQLETPANASFSKHIALKNDMPDGTSVPVLMPDGSQAYAVDDPHFLGPVIAAQKDRASRIVFYNLLPKGAKGDLFLPVDTSMMGSGEADMDMPYDPVPVPGGDVLDGTRNPMCTEKYYDPMMRSMCYTENRATLHLHGGTTPWISDGTTHQWITPSGESTKWPEGVSVMSVPDMTNVPGVPSCSTATDGCMSFYYTNQQSARLLFYHDHAWGITRLNVYAGEAAGYLISDPTEQKLISNGVIPADQIPLIIQDRTFVPQGNTDPTKGQLGGQLYDQDPTWDMSRWGGYGDLWYHHVYMTAQNPGDPSGMSAYGRWMYGPWFWPPAGDTKYGPIANPYYGKDPKGPDGVRGTGDDFTTNLAQPCNLDDPATWQYDTDPFCEPQLIPGTPNISVGMEQFNDTPIVNGTAYPTTTVQPKSYRLRILNAANDRFWNLQWYIADPTTGTDSEVALDPALVAAAQTDPTVFPTALKSMVVNNQTVDLSGPDWIQIGTEGGFLPAPVVVDGQQVTTWITDPTRFDFGNVDQHSLVLGPAERADVIVDFSQFAGKTLILYNDAPAAYPARVPSYDYYTGAPDQWPNAAKMILPGYGPNTRTVMQIKVAATTPAAPFDLNKLNSAFSHKADGTGVFESGQHPIIVGQAGYNSAYGKSFASSAWCNAPTNPTAKCDGYVRVSEQGGTMWKFDTLKGAQLAVKIEPKAIHDEMNASTFDEFGRMQANLGIEAVPATPGLTNVNLMPFVFPTTEIIDGTNLPKANVKVTAIASGSDGTQIWRFTHNGVDTHPIHFHLFDVQVLNRVTWDNIIIPPDPTEMGWKDTVRMSPLEDTIVALRPIVPVTPFDVPNSIRELSPMMVDGQPIALASVSDATGVGIPPSNGDGEPIDVYNHAINYGWEYVYHCHILSHEEMDMMRPVSLALPPVAPLNLTLTGPTGSGLSAHVDLTWTDNSRSETAWEIQRAASNTGPWTTLTTIPTAPTLTKTTGQSTGGTVTYSDVVGTAQPPFYYRVLAVNVVGDTWNYADPAINEIVSGGFPTVTTKSQPSNVAGIAGQTIPAAPSNARVTAARGTIRNDVVTLTWNDNSNNETGFTIQRASNATFTSGLQTYNVGANTTSMQQSVNRSLTLYYRIRANNAAGSSAWVNFTPFPIVSP